MHEIQKSNPPPTIFYCGFGGAGVFGFGAIAGFAGAASPAAPTSVAVLIESSLGQFLSR
jgi:hypothetical protein